MLKQCVDAGLRMTSQRVLIAEALESSIDHPDAEQLYRRVFDKDPSISVATVYRTLGIFEKAGLIHKVNVGDGRSRYEVMRNDHEHLVDVDSGTIHEFQSEELEKLLASIADEMGFEITGHRLELYGKKHGNMPCRCIQIKVY